MKPLVSCICITQNRRLFLRQAIRYFLARNHATPFPEVEMVILDGSATSAATWLETQVDWTQSTDDFRRIRYFHEPSPPHAKTGALHNRACELARGDIILQWDDDDWQAPDRIVKQLQALQSVSGPAFTFTSQFYWYHLAEQRACKSKSWHPGEGSVGATFAYHRKTWEAHPFRDVEQGEDNFFWQDLKAAGVPMIDTKDPSLVVYIRHNRNGSHATGVVAESAQATEDGLLRDSLWEEQNEDTRLARQIFADDLDFYDELSEILPLDQWNNTHARWNEAWRRQQLYAFAAMRRRG